MPLFVLLEHDHPQLHWDFMLEGPTALRTWRLAQVPEQAGVIEAEQLPDHRVAYLDYEGTVSGDRGSVIRVDRGEFRFVEDCINQIIVELSGQQLRGIAQLQRSTEDSTAWQFHWRPRAAAES